MRQPCLSHCGSIMDIESGAFWQPKTNRVCNDALRDVLKPEIQCQEIDAQISNSSFAEVAYGTLLQVMGAVIPANAGIDANEASEKMDPLLRGSDETLSAMDSRSPISRGQIARE